MAIHIAMTTQPARRVCSCDGVHRALEFPASPRSDTLRLSCAAPHVVRYVLCALPDAAPCVLYVAPDAAPCQQSGPQHWIPLVVWRALPGRTPPPVQIEKASFDGTLLPIS